MDAGLPQVGEQRRLMGMANVMMVRLATNPSSACDIAVTIKRRLVELNLSHEQLLPQLQIAVGEAEAIQLCCGRS